MPSMPDICEERPPREAKIDASGLSAPRAWTILATGDVAAIVKLREVLGVQRGSVYRDPSGAVPDPFCLCQSITAIGRPPAINGGVGLYRVVAEYADVTLSPQQAQPGKPTVWTVRTSLESQPIDVDADGVFYQSSSFEPVDPPLTAMVTGEVLHGEFYVPGTDALAAYIPFRPFNNTVNDNFLQKLGAPRGSLKCGVFQPEPSDTGWIKFSVDIAYKEPIVVFGALGNQQVYEGWQHVFPDMGRRELVAANATASKFGDLFASIRDARGGRLSFPVPLNGGGLQSSGGQPGSILDIDWSKGFAPALRVRNPYKHANFSAIPFP